MLPDWSIEKCCLFQPLPVILSLYIETSMQSFCFLVLFFFSFVIVFHAFLTGDIVILITCRNVLTHVSTRLVIVCVSLGNTVTVFVSTKKNLKKSTYCKFLFSTYCKFLLLFYRFVINFGLLWVSLVYFTNVQLICCRENGNND